MTGSRRKTVPAWVRWLLVPWADRALLGAILGAAVIPTMLVAAADIWRTEAGNQITEQLVVAAPTTALDVQVIARALFDDAAASATLDRTLVDRLRRIERLGEPTRTVFTDEGLTSSAAGEQGGANARLLARPGAVESLRVVTSGGPAGGVWVSRWYAERLGVGPGDPLMFESSAEPEVAGADVIPGGGVTATLDVAGVYEPIWSEDRAPPDGYWATVPRELVPSYLSPFRAPDFELLVMSESALAEAGVPGLVRWDTPLAEQPATLQDAQDLRAELRRLAADLTRDETLADAFATQGGTRPPAPRLINTFDDVVAAADDAAAQLDQPLGSAQAIGAILGMVVAAMSAVALVERRRTEFRLLAAEGDRWWAFAGRTGLQLVAPMATGGALGVLAATAVARGVGPADTFAFDAVGFSRIAMVTTGAWVVASLTAGYLGTRALLRTRGGDLRWFVAASALLAVALWVQVAREDIGRAKAVDLAATALAPVALLAVISVVLGMLGIVVRRQRLGAERLPTIPFLAYRRATGAGGSGGVLAGALAVGLGLMVFSTTLTGSLDAAIETKVAAEVGGETKVEILGATPPEGIVVPGATLVRVEQTNLSGGDQRVRIVAVDIPTFASAVDWQDRYGLDLATAVERLQTPGDDAVPVLAITGQRVGNTGSFGNFRPVPFRVVDRVRSVPMASDATVTLLVDAARIDAYELARLATALQLPPDDPAVLAEYRPPTDRYRRVLLSARSPQELTADLETLGLRVRNTVTQDQRAASADVLAPRFAFDYLKLLGAAALLAALAATALHQSAVREQRALATTMLRRMGLGRSRIVAVGVLDVLTRTAVAVAAALVAAPIIAGRLAARFDPAPRLPPPVSIEVPWVLMILAAAGVLLAVGVMIGLSEARGVGASRAQL